ncbi:MAG: Kae1-associated kinase Bud32 [Candidatus Poseidoniales archaeon]|nr:MAG: Kae1-associated kinase Bud32 [Euryarchaeota archaeon]RCH74591.1 MAG: Kae1-associated kinase Bud32 [Candidatus Poseidoniales archaeon]|tara:strand:+ start:18924 stop:19589 length:666 start_codon:yes stop_codon:yes gene_type:complete
MGAGMPWSKGPLIHEGAEGLVHLGQWFDGEAVMKVRRPRGYRDPSLDSALTKTRILSELRILRQMHHIGMNTPLILDTDIDSGTIIMTRIPGLPLFEHLRSTTLSENSVKMVLRSVGAIIRQLHLNGASHGDLTTHNIMWDEKEGVGLIDFGLGRLSPEIEALGQDIQVLNECLSASHPDHPYALEEVLTGYADQQDSGEPSASEVIERFNQIRGRVRYHG